LEQARRLQWIEKMLDHLAGGDMGKEDAAQWLCYYLGRKHDASFTLACNALGIPLVERMDEASAEAMGCEANIDSLEPGISDGIITHLRYRHLRPVCRVSRSGVLTYAGTQ
jgi:hypothetical protein